MVQYRHLLEFTRQAEQALLDYLKLVNSLPPDLSEDDLRLIREDAAGKIAQFTGFSIRDILETALEITSNGLIATVRQLDHLVRVRLACETLQLGSSAAIELGALRGNSPREAYRSAAEGALSSLSALLDPQAVPSQGELGQSETSWIVVDTQRLVARTEEKARCLLTVRNFLGQPLANITVTWESSLSSLDMPSSSSTDGNGQVWVDLQAGTEMGTAQVTARFGLDRQVLAPMVLIDCDASSLKFRNPVRTPDEALAGNRQVIDYRVETLDDHGNPGRDQVVHWSSDLGQFERPQTRTDAEGVATAHLSSLSSGEATVVAALPVNGEEHEYDPVTFLEQQYFQYLRFSGPVAVGQPTTATCRVVNLDGSPQAGVTVLWTADTGGFVQDPAQSVSDADGIASIAYLATAPGTVTLTVNARFDDKDLQPLSSARTPVHELPTLVEMEPAQQYYGLHQAEPAKFHVRLEPAAAGYPVTWWDGERLLATTYTSADGTAGYQSHFKESELGERTITVRSVKVDDQFDFKVNVVVPHTRLVPRGAPDDPGIDLAEEARWVFAVDPGLVSELQVFAERVDGVGDDDARLTFVLEDYADPVALGIVFDPPLGQELHCDPEGKVALKIDCTNAAFLANSDPSNNHMRLKVTSSLGVTLSIWVGLRYLLDLQQSELHFFRDSGSAGLSGQLRRRNGNAPLVLRAGSEKLRLSLEGAQEPQEVELFRHDDDGIWLYAPSFTGEAAELGSACTFEAVGDLGKRVSFAGSNVFEPQRIIDDATLILTADEDTGLLIYGNDVVVDRGGVSRCALELHDADGPLVGVTLLAGSTLINGIGFRSGGPTDAEGRTWVEVDTRNAAIMATGSMPLGLGDFYRGCEARVWEMAVVDLRAEWTGEDDIRAITTFTPREGHLFTHLEHWSMFFRCAENGLQTSFVAAAEGFTVAPTVARPKELPAVLGVGLLFEDGQAVWLLGQTQVEVTEDMTRGDAS